MPTPPAHPPGARRCRLVLTLAGMLWALASAVDAASPTDLYYERALMHAADQRCRLFQPEISAALNASSLQARGAALRSGVDDRDIAALAGRAAMQASRVVCGAAALQQAAERIRTAYAGYVHIGAMRFPGELSAWQAERNPVAPVIRHQAAEGPRWRLSEGGRWIGAGSGSVLLGLVGDNQAPAVVGETSGGAAASSAFLTLRDPGKSSEPYLNVRLHDPALRAPPTAITKTFVAEARDVAPMSLLPAGRGMVFTFPAAVARAMEALDPREVVTVEFAYPGRPNERAVFEVGDFAAGRAFLLAGR